MDYLFFDIECANCFKGIGKICEFGYVLTDKDFNILQQGEMIINPNDKYDFYVVKNILTYPKSFYIEQPLYPHFFPQIKELFSRTNTLYFGYGVGNDVKYLNNESTRYSLDYLDYEYYDVRSIYAAFEQVKEAPSLNKAAASLDFSDAYREHRALEDALTTLFVLRRIMEKKGLDFERLANDYDITPHHTQNGSIAVKANQTKRGGGGLKEFIRSVKPQGEIIQSPLNGKTLSMSMKYQNENVERTKRIIQLLKNRDCQYLFKASDCDYFVDSLSFDKTGAEIVDARKRHVLLAISQGKNIQIVDACDLADLLNVKAQDID